MTIEKQIAEALCLAEEYEERQRRATTTIDRLQYYEAAQFHRRNAERLRAWL